MKKRIFAFVVIIAVFLNSGVVANAAAMSTFPAQNTASYSVKYTRAIQVMMVNYSSKARSNILTTGGPNGNYGSGTAAAVMNFQTLEGGLTIDGKCGPNTWNALHSMLMRGLVDRKPTNEYSEYFYYKGPYPYTYNNIQYCMILWHWWGYIGGYEEWTWSTFYQGKTYEVG